MADTTVDAGPEATYSSLARLVQLAALPASAADTVEIIGGGPVFPTRYNIVPPGAAAIAATGLTAADLWALQGFTRRRGAFHPPARPVRSVRIRASARGVARRRTAAVVDAA